jgi:endonuclease-3
MHDQDTSITSHRKPLVTKKTAKKTPTKSSRAAKISPPQLAKTLVHELAQVFPVAECALYHKSAFQLLVATILSAQCTDERVNSVTPTLFEKYPTAEKLADAELPDVEKIVKSLGFFRAKTSNIVSMAKSLVAEHGGKVPATLEELIELAGVGRKTANVVLGTWFGIPSGVVVDTHVKRITNIWGLTKSQQPEIIERDLIALLPETEWINYSHRVIHLGRKWCVARNPKCLACPLLKNCPRVGLKPLTEQNDADK